GGGGGRPAGRGGARQNPAGRPATGHQGEHRDAPGGPARPAAVTAVTGRRVPRGGGGGGGRGGGPAAGADRGGGAAAPPEARAVVVTGRCTRAGSACRSWRRLTSSVVMHLRLPRRLVG